jgi:glycosyltransferase involved in cell wall biosynthesis
VTRLNVLISAYACEPGKGSEPGVGWNMAHAMASINDVWVLTRANNRDAIEAELSHRFVPGLHVRYVDLPPWTRWWKRRQRGIHAYYYMWQFAAYRTARRLSREVDFDIAHHVTFVKYWVPSLMAFLQTPFVWGPVGGAESAPEPFLRDFSTRGRLYEAMRSSARALAERDPYLLHTARRSALSLATTQDTATRLLRLGARNVHVYPQTGTSGRDLIVLGRYAKETPHPARFMSIGRLLHWKGFHLGIRAFARAAIPGSEYWIAGSGPELPELRRLTASLGLGGRVTFFGELPWQETVARLARSAALIHPSLHDSGGMVCLEAMACERPVICLDLGGPGMQVTDNTGFKVPATDPDQAIRDMADAMRLIADEPDRSRRLGMAGRRRVEMDFQWETKARQLHSFYEQVLAVRSITR